MNQLFKKVKAVILAFSMAVSLFAGIVTVNEAKAADAPEFEPGCLYAAALSSLSVKGDRYVYSGDIGYDFRGYFGAGSLKDSLYMLFKYGDDNGRLAELTDPSKLTFYRSEYNEEKQAEDYTKVDSSVIKVEKIYSDSNIMKISYVGDTKSDWNEYAVTYNGAAPSSEGAENNIEVAFVTSDFNEIGTYNSTSLSESTYINEIKADDISDVVFYVTHFDISKEIPWNVISKAKLKNLELIDENGNNLSSKVTSDPNVTLTEAKGRAIIYGEKFTIPKGALNSSAKLTMWFDVHSKGGDGVERDNTVEISLYIFYAKHTHTAAATWEKDATDHWHICTGADKTVLDKAAHTWDPGVVTTPATTTVEGVKTYTCTVCGATKTEAIAKLSDADKKSGDDKGASAIKLSSVSCKKGKKVITGKVSVKKATVKIKVGSKGFVKAKVKGKKFTLNLKTALKKNTKIVIKVTAKNHSTVKKSYKVK